MAAGTYISAAHLKAVMKPPNTFTVSTISEGSINQLSDIATCISYHSSTCHYSHSHVGYRCQHDGKYCAFGNCSLWVLIKHPVKCSNETVIQKDCIL